MAKQKSDRWLVRNRKIRAENDFNRIMCEYVTFKYGPIAKEVCTFYDQLRDKYPAKAFYKGSKGFRAWVHDEIKTYVDEHPSSGDEDVSDANETGHLAAQVVETEPEKDVLSQAVREACFDELQPIEADIIIGDNIHEEQRQQQLNELDNIVNQIIADLEMDQDEGIGVDLFQSEGIPLSQSEDILENWNEPLVEWW